MLFDFELKIIDDSYSIYSCPQDWHVTEQGAIFHRVYYVYDGFVVYEDDNQSFQLRKGFMYIFPANRQYKIRHDPQAPLKCLWFHITISPVILNPVISCDVHKSSVTDNLIKTMESAVRFRSECGMNNLLAEQLLKSFVYLISLQVPFITVNNDKLKSVIDYIQTNYGSYIDNQLLSNLCGYDKSYFIRLFQKILGMPPQKYVMNYRIGKAATFIRDSMPISEVSNRVGYTDVKAFSRAFKKLKGVAPSEYRNSHYLQP